jgi:hypothetical protein
MDFMEFLNTYSEEKNMLKEDQAINFINTYVEEKIR